MIQPVLDPQILALLDEVRAFLVTIILPFRALQQGAVGFWLHARPVHRGLTFIEVQDRGQLEQVGVIDVGHQGFELPNKNFTQRPINRDPIALFDDAVAHAHLPFFHINL